MDDYDFEYFVADLWEKQGWECAVSQASMDAGIDVTATKSSPYDQKKLIQAKRYGPNTTVGGPDIQQYASLKHQQPDADSVVVVTSNQFTNSAEERAKDLNVKLVDGDDLEGLIRELEAFDIVEKYAPRGHSQTGRPDSGTSHTDTPLSSENNADTTTTGEGVISPDQSPGWLRSLEQDRAWHRLFPKAIGAWFVCLIVVGALEGTGVELLSSFAGLVSVVGFLPLTIALPVIWYLDMRYVRSVSDWTPHTIAYLAGGVPFPYIAIPLYYYRRYKTIGI